MSDKLGLSRGLVVQELGWDEDVDDDVRLMIEDAIDGELVEEAMEAVLDTEAGKLLKELRDGPLGEESVEETQVEVARERAEERAEALGKRLGEAPEFRTHG